MRFCWHHADEAADRLASEWREADRWASVTVEVPVAMLVAPAEQDTREWLRAAGTLLLEAVRTTTDEEEESIK